MCTLPESIRHACEGRLETAVALARLAGRSTLDLFGAAHLSVERKSDDSPVTQADKRAEQLIREELARLFPDDAVLGEEFGSLPGTSGFQWVVDPIDGTKSFISGVPLYSTLVGVIREGKSVAGVIYVPALDEIVFAAKGFGAWHSLGASPPQPCRVSHRSLSEGLFVVSQVDTFAKQGREQGYLALEREAYITRSWGDGYGYLLVATGRAEVMVDALANAWDLAAIQPVLEEAGGEFTDWSGQPHVFGGNGVGSNSLVHARVLQLLNG